MMCVRFCVFFQAEDGIRDAQESRGLGDVYKRQFQQSVTDFGNSLKSLNVSQIQAAGDTVKSSGDAMISSARPSYPTETTALRSSIDQVQSGLSGLATSNDKPAAVASLVANLETLQTAYKAPAHATSSDRG